MQICNEPRFKTKAQCESNGECHGPSLQENLCDRNGCEVRDHVCLTTQSNHQCVTPSECSQAAGMECMGQWGNNGYGCSGHCWIKKFPLWKNDMCQLQTK